MPANTDPSLRSNPWKALHDLSGAHRLENTSHEPIEFDPLQAHLDAYSITTGDAYIEAVKASITAEAERMATLGSVGLALDRIAPFVQSPVSHAPLVRSEQYSEEFGCEVYFKDETQLSVGSFKLRGALNATLNRSAAERENGLNALSAGNHAQGVTKAAQIVGTEATIFMPTTTPKEKVAAVKALGGQVLLTGHTLEETAKAYESYTQAHPEQIAIHPYDDFEVIAGQGTAAYELLSEQPNTTHIFVPVGGGGLLAGTHLAANEKGSKALCIGVEPEHSASFNLAIRRGRRDTLRQVHTQAEGSAVARMGAIPYEIITDDPDNRVRSLVVAEHALHSATVELNNHWQRPVECTGALGFAALRAYNDQYGFRPHDVVVAMVTGKHRNEASYHQMQTMAVQGLGRLTMAS